MKHPEALQHPEVKLLDEGFCPLLLTLAQCSSIQQSVLVTKLSEALLLDVVNLLTLGVLPILSICASLSLTGSNFTRRGELTDAWGDIYLISLRQSKFNRKQLHYRLSYNLVLDFVYLAFMD